jgi:hypothetical protein
MCAGLNHALYWCVVIALSLHGAYRFRGARRLWLARKRSSVTLLARTVIVLQHVEFAALLVVVGILTVGSSLDESCKTVTWLLSPWGLGWAALLAHDVADATRAGRARRRPSAS